MHEVTCHGADVTKDLLRVLENLFAEIPHSPIGAEGE